MILLADVTGHDGVTITQLQTRRCQRLLTASKIEVVDHPVNEQIRGGNLNANANLPPAQIVGDDVKRYNNITVTRPFLGPNRNTRLRLEPNGPEGQIAVPFPDGHMLIPLLSVEMGEVERYNQEDP